MGQRYFETILEEYEELEGDFIVKASHGDLGELVTFNGNRDIPIHRWFTFKEGFSSKFVPWIIGELSVRPKSILDPFCGVGTSLLSFQLAKEGQNCEMVGVEINPFIQFVADTKLSWYKCNPQTIEQLTEKVSKPITLSERRRVQIPELATIQNPRTFKNGSLEELLALKKRIDKLGDSVEKKALRLAWASTIEKVSSVRKDGRALRFINRSEDCQVVSTFKSYVSIIVTDIRKCSAQYGEMTPAKVRLGDGRNLQGLGLKDETFDLSCYSPPYPNNIDYSEVYKLELWLSGYIKTHSQFRDLRSKTFRSHPSIKFNDTAYLDNQHGFRNLKEIRSILIESLPKDRWRLPRERIIRGYLDDLLLALWEQKRVTKRNGSIVCVVGNSLHGPDNHPILIAADLIVAEIAKGIGLHVEKIQVARQLKRRHCDTKFLRESIVVIRK